jgi:hypothetical protein
MRIRNLLTSEEIRELYAPQAKPPVRRVWNRHKAYDSLLTVCGMAAVGAFLAYMIVGWLDGTFY